MASIGKCVHPVQQCFGQLILALHRVILVSPRRITVQDLIMDPDPAPQNPDFFVLPT